MSERKIIEGNKLIAEFMGYVFTETPDCGILSGNKFTKVPKIPNEPPFTVFHGWYPPKYHSSWDLLFPVLTKITEMNYRWEIGMSSPYFYCKILPVGKLERLTPIEATYDMIIEFLLWFNKQ